MGASPRRTLSGTLIIWVLVTAVPSGMAQQEVRDPRPAEAQEIPVERVAAERLLLTDRIVGLLGEIASNARTLPEPGLKLTCQLQAASMLWLRDPDLARDVYREAFDAVLPSMSADTEEIHRLSPLQSELLMHVARRDPALAERFAARLERLRSDRANPSSPGDAASRADLLTAAAIEMLPDDPQRAAALGRLALGEQITPSFVRLLVVLRGVDRARADELFGVALEMLSRNPTPQLADIQVLTFYVSATSQSGFEGIPDELFRAYLDAAFRIIVLTPLDSSDAPGAYFLSRELIGLYGHYLPERVPELESRVAALSRSNGLQVAVPVAERREETEDVRHARAAAAAIERNDFTVANSEAAAIEDEALRSRVFVQATLRLVKSRRFDEALREIGRIPDPARRATLLVQLAHAAHGRGDFAYTVELLTQAGKEAARAERPGARMQALFSVASAFAEVDQLRAFEAMQTAVDSVNRASRAVGPSAATPAELSPSSLDFDATLARLARMDFDRALLLSEQFDPRGHRLLAQLAVCRGGLVSAGFALEDLEGDEPLSSL